MSSLAAARADNFYYPPEWEPQMGGISKFQGSKGKNQYEQHGIIRFELPFDAWCLGCGIHMTKGLRFNAKKEKEGKYFTTQIWAFMMKCFSCEQRYKIKTDPQNATYDMAEGIRKHEQDFTPDADDSLIVATSDETRQLIANDPMFRLQHNEEDRQKVLSAKERMDALIEVQEAHHKDYYDANALLRDRNRKRKKRDIELKAEGAARGLSMPLLEPSQQDADTAKEVNFKKRAITNSFNITERHRINNIQAQSVFDRPATVANNSNNNTSKHNHNSSVETRLVLHNKQSTTSTSSTKKPVVTDSRGKFSATARLLSKANAVQVDARALKLSGPALARSASALAGDVATSGFSSVRSATGVSSKVKIIAVRPNSNCSSSGNKSSSSVGATDNGKVNSRAGATSSTSSSLLDMLGEY